MSQVIAYLDCHSGISGNMFLGALLDAGLPFAELQHALEVLPLSDYQLTCERFSDKGIAGAHFEVQLSSAPQPVRHLVDIQAILHAAALAPRVRDRALAVFQCLAEAEASVHGTSIDEVHFH